MYLLFWVTYIFKALWQLKQNNQNSRKLENIIFVVVKTKIKYIM